MITERERPAHSNARTILREDYSTNSNPDHGGGQGRCALDYHWYRKDLDHYDVPHARGRRGALSSPLPSSPTSSTVAAGRDGAEEVEVGETGYRQ